MIGQVYFPGLPPWTDEQVHVVIATVAAWNQFARAHRASLPELRRYGGRISRDRP